MSLLTRFYLLFLAFALAPVLIVGIWFLSSNSEMQENAQQFHKQIAALAAQMSEVSAAKMNRSLNFVEDLERNKAENPLIDSRILRTAAATHSELELLVLFDASGRQTQYLADPDLFPERLSPDDSLSALIHKAVSAGVALVGRTHIQSGTPLVPIAYPLPGGRSLYAEYSLKSLWKRINQMRVGKSGRVVILSLQGEKLSGIARGFPEHHWKLRQKISEDSGWIDNIPTHSGVFVGDYARISSLHLLAMSLEPRAEAFSEPKGFALRVIFLFLIVFTAAAAGAWWVSGRLVPPLQQLVLAAQRAARNDLSRPVREEGWGEIKNLSRDFNVMIETLRSYQELQVDKLLIEQARIASLVQSLPEGVIMADFDGKIVSMNAVSRLIFGVGVMPEVPIAVTLGSLIKAPDLREIVQEVLTRKKRVSSGVIEIKSTEGISRGIFQAQGAIVRSQTRDIGILLLLRDITMERRLEEMKDEFFHSIVHDIRSPVASLDAFFQLIGVSPNLNEKEKRYLGYARDSSKRLLSLVADILDMAKLESGTMQAKIAPAEVEVLLSSVRAGYWLQAQERKIELKIAIENGAPKEIACDGHLIERVVTNLMGNAFKFTPSGGSITLGARASGPGGVEISVSDTGPGIPKNALDAVFEKFKQLDQGGSAKAGYGLGLAICKKMVELHGGKIWAESEGEGKGSRFAFYLPGKQGAPSLKLESRAS